MKKLAFVIVMILFACDTEHNIPDPTESYFVKYFGTEGNQEAADMIVNSDGTILMLGTSREVSGFGQVYLIKASERGEIIWEQFYKGVDDRTAIDIEPMVDGNYVILYNTFSIATGSDINIMVIGPDGLETSSKAVFSYAGATDEIGVSVTPLVNLGAPAGFIVAGSTNNDPSAADDPNDTFKNITALFVRINPDGTIFPENEWINYHSSNGKDYCTKVVQVDALSAADPFMLFGYTDSDKVNVSFNFWASRLNKNGTGLNLSAAIIPGSSTTSDEILKTVISTSVLSNSYLMCGVSSNDRIYLAGNLPGILPQEIGLVDLGDVLQTNNPLLEKVVATKVNGGFLIAANTIFNGKSDIALVKVGVDGNAVWNDAIYYGGQGDDYISSISQLPNGKILMLGTMSIGDDNQKKLALIKTNKDGLFKN